VEQESKASLPLIIWPRGETGSGGTTRRADSESRKGPRKDLLFNIFIFICAQKSGRTGLSEALAASLRPRPPRSHRASALPGLDSRRSSPLCSNCKEESWRSTVLWRELSAHPFAPLCCRPCRASPRAHKQS